MTRLRRTAAALALSAPLLGAAPAPTATVIAGGTIYDGASTKAVIGDVAVSYTHLDVYKRQDRE